MSEALAIVHASAGDERTAMLIKLLQMANAADAETRQVWMDCAEVIPDLVRSRI